MCDKDRIAVAIADGLWIFLKVLFLEIPLKVARVKQAKALYPVVFGVIYLLSVID